MNQPVRQAEHDYLYWEFYEQGGKQAVRFGKWKAMRSPMYTGKIELYDLSKDLGESNDIAVHHRDIVRRSESMMAEAHQNHPNWKPRGCPTQNTPMPGDGRRRF